MSAQLALRFDGSDYDHDRDAARLTNQLQKIWDVIEDRRWYTLKEISTRTGEPEASISAQLRHLRKPRFGSHQIEKKYLGSGLYSYRLNGGSNDRA